jgi:hypothetical protein
MTDVRELQEGDVPETPGARKVEAAPTRQCKSTGSYLMRHHRQLRYFGERMTGNCEMKYLWRFACSMPTRDAEWAYGR